VQDERVEEQRTSGGDPAATLALLWRGAEERPTARRGPRRTLSVDQVVVAAVALADHEGLTALTMRSLAQRLGIAAMSVYTYVPGRAELLDLMLDHVYAGMARTATDDLPWRERVRAVAEDNRTLYRHHPWAAEVSTLRPPLGPGQLAKYEHELTALDGLGLTDVQLDDALSHLLTFVRANARDALAAAATRRETDQDDQAWWATAGPLLERVLRPGSYPLASRIGTAAGTAHQSAHDPEHAYTFGLGCVLAAFEALVAGGAAAA
jgi:AcrR family transcriptional regulator